MVRDNRKDSLVDLVLGNGFGHLVPKAEATVPSTAVPTPTKAPGC